MFTLREARSEDLAFLRQVLGWAANWRSNEIVGAVIADPAVSRYVDGFGRAGDEGVVADDEQGDPIGAAWYRYFSEVEPGFGFIAAHIPEVAVAVAPGSRGRGVGTALLQALADRARREGLSALSLSVEEGNQAVRLYERIGFNPVGRDDNALTMRLDLRRD
jgi:GNAT superfamily N-acetyltransferase